MAHQPGDAATTRRLLTTLAALPSDDTPENWVHDLRTTVDDIRSVLIDAEQQNTPTVPFEAAHRWRNNLDIRLDAMRNADPHQWLRHRQPGTWLDSLLRLRSILAHVVGKAYWDDHSEITYAHIDVERYLWGAR